ncbi:SCO family protein [Nitrogeniibacter mangrovi]|uniref:SCO family protein n=1 Tax=Nitrogeniibacter mangrovi TaxID=2016596 RepID=A0A6C1B0E9_9RHOO|nr:SCO family protein [Nitrogeniibacter mangrovi]QID17091.1 SCO family protein [Nitrogeniibacter mangrovi]
MLRFLLLVAAFAVTACSPADKPASFRNTDITGVDYGSHFELTDHNGVKRSLADYRGKVVTVFFGYTQCPDVCPTNLSTMASVMQLLGDDAARVQVLFITVDPERDTPELLKQYVPAFDPRFVGLYGTAEQTAAVAREFKVFYRKSGDTSGSNYTVDHSAGTYVFDPAGHLRLYVKHGTAAEDIAADIHQLLTAK